MLLMIVLSPIFYGILYLIYVDAGIIYDSVELTLITSGLIMIIGCAFTCYYDWWVSRVEEHSYERIRKESYIGSAWKSFKEKVCVRLEFE
jgi:hypothetical protein